MKVTKENTLYLPIKQIYFDAIIEGTKKEEYREIKDTTFKKYLETWKEHGEEGFVFNDEKFSPDQELDIMMYNNGVYPFIPIEYKYLNLAVGYEKERDTAIVEVTDITFEIAKDKNGKDVRFFWDEEDGLRPNINGDSAMWNIVYHLGKVVELKRKGEKL
ncbi:MAG: ASCH domain-containing protein [Paludibacter sp.]